MGWTLFRIAADLCHITSKCILIFSIHRNRSSEGVSLLTQLFYALVFVSRYTDLFRESFAWNYFFKVFYLLSSFYTIAVMRFVYPRTREREVAWKLSALILLGVTVLSPFIMMIFEESHHWSFQEYLWVFSQVLESLAVLPQLLLLRQTTIPTVITSFYIVFLGSYRGLYLLNWIQGELDTNMKTPNPISVIFGVIQTALYLDFAWVYWSRQRVKLRNGGVVDADDLSRGWLLRRIFGSKQFTQGSPDGAAADDEESAPALGGARRNDYNHHQNGSGGGASGRPKWGSRGISISADEGVLEHERARALNGAGEDDDDEEHGFTDVVDPDAKMRDPDELARALDEDEDLEGAGASSSQQQKQGAAHTDSRGQPSGVRSGDEWDDD